MADPWQPATPLGLGDPSTVAGDALALQLAVEPLDCDCFELTAVAHGGEPPYRFEWQDGLMAEQRRVCPESLDDPLMLVAVDAGGVRSAPQLIELPQMATDCAASPREPDEQPMLCLQNPSFEGTPVANLGLTGEFDAVPWSACTNPERANAPVVGNPSSTFGTPVVAPAPVDGVTYLGLAEGHQVSQPICSQPPAGAELSLELYAAQVTVGPTVPGADEVFLELWSGLESDCTEQELLWRSPALAGEEFERHCITLKPSAAMSLLMLRAEANTSDLALTYVLVDNLNPVDGCR